MSTEEQPKRDLLEALRQSLEAEGKLGKLKAELRWALVSVLNKTRSEEPLPAVPEETRLLNDLIREYLIWNGYSYTDQTLLTESGQCGEKPSREHLAARLGVIDDSQTAKIPLLYYVVSAFTQQGEEEEAP